MNPSLLNRVLLLLGAVGMFIAGFLSFTALSGRAIPCGPERGCDVLARLPESKWLGQPVALYGLVAYVLLFVLAAARPSLAEPWRRRTVVAGLFLSGLGAMMSFGLMNLLYGQLKLHCPWCIGSAVTMVTTFILYGVLSTRTETEWKPGFMDSALSGALFVMAVGGAGMYGMAMSPNEIRIVDPSKISSIEDIVPNKSYFMGPENARVTIIEFADFYCPACRSTATRIKELKAAHPKTLRVAYRHLPLYGKEGHEMSLPGAVASEIAAEHGKYWEFIDAIFGPAYENVTDVQQFVDLLKQVGVPESALKDGLGSSETPAFNAVVQSVETARKLGISSTPSFVVIVQGQTPILANANSLNEVLSREQVRAALEGRG